MSAIQNDKKILYSHSLQSIVYIILIVFYSEESMALFKGKRDSGWMYYIVGCVDCTAPT